jgi:membrane protein YdbS with pleckstrin-like domain
MEPTTPSGSPPAAAPAPAAAATPAAPEPAGAAAGRPQAAPPVGSTGHAAEEIFFQGIARHTASLGGYAFWTFICFVGGLLVYVLNQVAMIANLGLPLWVLAFAGVPGLIWVWLVHVTSRFKVSARRVEIEKGVITKRIDSLELWRVLDVQYEQSILDRITGDAKIKLIGTDQTHPVLLLHGMPDHRRLFERLRDAVQVARHTSRPMEFAPGSDPHAMGLGGHGDIVGHQ